MALPVINNAPPAVGARTVVPGLSQNVAVDGGGLSGTSEIAPQSITTGAMHPTTLQVSQVVLTAAQIDTMFTTPIVLVPAQGANTSILVDYAMFRYTSGGTAFTGGGVITIGYAGGAAAVNTVAAATINTTTSSDTILVTGAANVTAKSNAAIQITNATGVFATGNGTVTIYIYYSVL